MRSVVVVLPASICAVIPIFLIVSSAWLATVLSPVYPIERAYQKGRVIHPWIRENPNGPSPSRPPAAPGRSLGLLCASACATDLPFLQGRKPRDRAWQAIPPDNS